MKKIFLICLACLFIGGCTSLQKLGESIGIKVTPELENILEIGIAYNAGLEFGYQKPKMINRSIRHCDNLLKAEKNSFAYLWDLGIKELNKKAVGDPVLQGNINIILEAVTVEGEFNIESAKTIIVSFRKGLIDRQRMIEAKK